MTYPETLSEYLYENAQRRLGVPGLYQTHPLPIPAGAKAHGISMIFASAFGELGEFLGDRTIVDVALDHAHQVMDVFRRPDHRRLYEFVRLDNALMDAPPGRVVNPGHAIESMWFMIHLFQRENDAARIQQAIETAGTWNWDGTRSMAASGSRARPKGRSGPTSVT
jgi:N-acylglucosamine 2-epimerase